MATKDNDKSKTSKTARVMNLLSKKPDPAQEETTEIAGGQPSSQPLPPIISSLAPDAAVSAQIKGALEDALEDEHKIPLELEEPGARQPEQEPEKPAEPAQPEPAPVSEPMPAPEPEPAPAPEEPAAPLPEPVEPAPISAQPEPKLTQPVSFDPSNLAAEGYINVMQVLVEEKALKYVQMFGLCQCDQCMADVKALALNHLPPKYVVMRQGDMIPKLTFYEGKYGSDIIAQLLNACRIVKEHPHHHR